MTLSNPIRTVQPVLHNVCPKCQTAIAAGKKRVYVTIGSCECEFPVPRMVPGEGYSRLQRDADLDYLEQYEQLTCSVALANGLITGWQCQAQERRIARMREKCNGLLLAIASRAGDKRAVDSPRERRHGAADTRPKKYEGAT